MPFEGLIKVDFTMKVNDNTHLTTIEVNGLTIEMMTSYQKVYVLCAKMN